MRFVGQHHGADDIGIEDVEQAVFFEVGNLAPVHVAGVAEQRVETVAMFDGFSHHAGAVFGNGHIANHRATSFADRFGNLGQDLGPPAGDRHQRAAGRKVASRALTDARTAPGDEHRHVLNRTHRLILLRSGA